ncbi:hypothetical protein [Neisseria sp. Ec49-e6-T10]|uniref:hypothetical protein n=1 Tax=Neisseria sp. Ec49-e6-T10 TaxID=3140744 RepID=UPI003EB7AD1B
MENKFKKVILLFGLSFLCMTVFAEVNVPSQIKFGGEVYKQIYQAGNGTTSDKVTEYLIKGETLEKFEKMFSIFEYPNVKDRKKFVGLLVNNPSVPYKIIPREVFENKADTETIVSLIINAGNISEYNIYRVLMRNNHVVTYQFSYRVYEGHETAAYKKWQETIDKNESLWITAIAKMKDIK